MKEYLLLGLASLFVVSLSGEAAESEAVEQAAEDAYYELLGEEEFLRFIQVFPVFQAEAEKLSMEWEEADSPQHVGTWLEQVSKTSKDIAGLDTKLKDAGMPWDEFWPAFGKTMLAFTAVMYDSSMLGMENEMREHEEEIAELQAKLNDPNISAEEQEMIRSSLEMMKTMSQSMKQAEDLYVEVPQPNKDIIKEYWEELVVILEIGVAEEEEQEQE